VREKQIKQQDNRIRQAEVSKRNNNKLTMQHLRNRQLAVLEEEEQTKHSNNNKLAMQRHSQQPEVEVEEEHKKKTNKITLKDKEMTL
jgi:hypothetical protein